MLTEREKHGISEMLDRMSSRDLASLAQTVTSRLIVPETKAEAINAIILHTDKPIDLLRRRKVKKEFLFKYLNAKRVCIEATSDKSVIMSAVLQLWGSATLTSSASSGCLTASAALIAVSLEEDSLPEAPAPSRNTSYSSLCSLDFNAPLPGNTGGLIRSVLGRLPVNDAAAGDAPLRRSESTNSFIMDDDDDDNDDGIDLGIINDHRSRPVPRRGFNLHDRLSHSLTPTPPPPPSLSSSYASPAPSVIVPASLQAAVVTESLLSSSAPSSYNPFLSLSTASSVNTMSPVSSSGSPTCDDEVQAMADSFVKWFYELLNATFFSIDSAEFGPQHFWIDASAKISLHQGDSSKESDSESICVQGDGAQVCDALKHVVRKYRVTYNPNMSRDGVTGYVDIHGLAVVSACGTLHNPSNSTACGTFQQQFGLIRDPNLGNNWKIKFTHVTLISKNNIGEIPCLDQNPFNNSTSSSAMALS